MAYQMTKSLLPWSMRVGMRPLGLYFVYSGLFCSCFPKSRYFDSNSSPSSARTKATFLRVLRSASGTGDYKLRKCTYHPFGPLP